MQVFRVSDDAEGRCWRIEFRDDRRVRVYQDLDGWLLASPVALVSDIASLGRWLVERGLTEADLTPA